MREKLLDPGLHLRPIKGLWSDADPWRELREMKPGEQPPTDRLVVAMYTGEFYGEPAAGFRRLLLTREDGALAIIDEPVEPKSPEPSYTCPRCRRTSYHRMDIKHRFCGACGVFE